MGHAAAGRCGARSRRLGRWRKAAHMLIDSCGPIMRCGLQRVCLRRISTRRWRSGARARVVWRASVQRRRGACAATTRSFCCRKFASKSRVRISSLCTCTAPPGRPAAAAAAAAARRGARARRYQALRKATYKPGAFFKGIVLPLCEVAARRRVGARAAAAAAAALTPIGAQAGDASFRDATIVASVVKRARRAPCWRRDVSGARRCARRRCRCCTRRRR